MLSRLISFAVALAIVTLLTPLFRSLAVHLGLVDVPAPRKIHLRATPLLGGLGVYLAVVLGLLVGASRINLSSLVTLLLGATFLAIVGLIDDRVGLDARVKLLAAIPFAGLILAAGDIRVTAFPLTRFWDQYPIVSFGISLALTVLWVVIVTSSFAILDHMNGLCAGIAAIASLCFLLLAVAEGLVLVGILSAAMLGATLGFLRWNLRSASIFLGDTGALFIGFMIAVMAILLRFSHVSVKTSWMIPLLVLWVPLFDAMLVFVSRLRRGISPMQSPGKDHTAHRLANLGVGDFGAVLCLYVVSGLFGALGLFVRSLTTPQAYGIAGCAVAASVGAIALLESLPFEKQSSGAGSRVGSQLEEEGKES
jgi:UDP-GlcNAc:undecaprenyl-phosphate GlcNAc-1-phosphate transferase